MSYQYSGTNKTATGWTSALVCTIKERLEEKLKTKFNFALLNLYKNGDDYIGWHSDDESGLMKGGVIASVSFGAERTFQLRKKPKGKIIPVQLKSGSTVVMYGTTQRFYKHAVPKRKKVKEFRINITFRQIKL